MDHVGAAILAGGRATRMAGADKGRLLVGGTPIIERQLAVLRTLVPRVLVIGGRVELARVEPAPEVEIVPDALPGRGPLGGIYTALLHSEAPVTLVLAGDMPFVSAPFLQHLVAAMGDGEVAVPRSADGWHPLCAAYSRTLLPIVEEHLTRGRLAVVDLLRDVRVAEIGPEALARFDPERIMLSNVNTPQDYERACARAGRA
jgi:molybdopterin-guanine dinucleotide biosynthesis protein A